VKRQTIQKYQVACATSRRKFIGRSATALAGLSAAELLADEKGVISSYAPRQPHFAPRAKQVIYIYMSGGYSHVDTFDPKPRLTIDHDSQIGVGDSNSSDDDTKKPRFLKAPLWTFRPNRRCGTQVSDLFPHLREVMHDVALIRSMNCDLPEHGVATLQLHTGSTNVAMPGIGAWISHGLGTLNPNLPPHVVISEFIPYSGAQLWDSVFLPTAHRGLRLKPGNSPIENVKPQEASGLQDLELGLAERLNRLHLQRNAGNIELAGRMATFDAARNLQIVAPQSLDLSQESETTLKLYGVEADDNTSYGAQCIMARRLIERGVRFVELIDSVGNCQSNWDSAHRDIKEHEKYAMRVDKPVAALIQDLKARGLLQETLVVFCTEFGRTPWNQDGKPGAKNRTHHASAFSCWLAGGGVKGGITYGETDDIGNEVVENPVHVHDFHATILHLLGLDHEKLTFRYSGRDFRLTDVYGTVAKGVLA